MQNAMVARFANLSYLAVITCFKQGFLQAVFSTFVDSFGDVKNDAHAGPGPVVSKRPQCCQYPDFSGSGEN
jgi:hypothetical protein